ncbi:MAG: glycosyltransferase family 4 protein [Bacteroidetes bacterium]|nr:glycosyltransferase family 4 protein [Bacteroidota bacterium]
MANILYVLGVKLPDEVRAEKICRSLVADGHTVTVLSRWYPSMAEREVYHGYTVARFGKNLKSWQSSPVSVNPNWKKAIKQEVQRFSPDIIITREILLAGASNQIARQNSIPSLIDMAENYPAAMRGWKKYQSRFLSRFAVNTLKLPSLLEKHAVSGADGIIVVCDEQVQRLVKNYNYPHDNIVVVHNTPELQIFDSVKKGSSTPPKVFGHHGYFTLERGLENFVLGFELAASVLPEIQLSLHGTGETYLDVENIISNSSFKDRIELNGEYSLSKIAEIYQNSDIGVLPYIPNAHISTTIANKLFDYIACGKPVIVSEASPMRRIIEETGAGICADCSTPESISKAIQKIFSSNIAEMRENGQKFAKKKYNWAVDSERLCKFVLKFIT